MGSAREAALITLTACERQGAWSDGYLKKALREQELDKRDAALASRLCYGVLQNRLLLDWQLARFCNKRLEALDAPVLCGLRAAVYQILFLDKIPPSAAVNEAVELTKKYCRNPRAAGMVNGILRAMLRQKDLPEPEGCDKAETLSLKYSHPLWLVEEFIDTLGPEGAERLLEADNLQPPTAAQINPLRGTLEKLTEELREAGAEATPHPWMPGCLLLSGGGDLERLAPFQEGRFYVQDPAARLAVTAAGVTPGQRVLDCCAAQGWPLDFYSAGELAALEGDFTPSERVLRVTGVDNVCERAAAMGGGRLIVGKTVRGGVTVAVAEEGWTARFPGQAGSGGIKKAGNT